ncbi:MAG: LPS assembly protein LptD [Nitrospira sp.]|nr:LPS assembly protein LptD [Nitrospira sp.]MCP9463001.1 LPS assembly protein LptD [Nitrospira sp.]MCP9475847.1 LPS assembly protein LptD [Nitrospira sp.]
MPGLGRMMRRSRVLALAAVLLWIAPFVFAAETDTDTGGPPRSSTPLDVTAARLESRQDQEVYEAEGSVVVRYGAVTLTADRVTIHMLPGVLTASGHVHLTDPQTDLTAERLELNVNTEAGVVIHGRLFASSTNSYVTGRLFQRFSDSHYRVKEGSFTNCDAQEGEVPAWRLKFEDLDARIGDTLSFSRGWFCVNDVPLIPVPGFTYPLTRRKTGLLIPVVSYDNRFGFHAQASFYWAINPSQDLTIAPKYYSNLGYGSDFDYRYVLNRQSRGQWHVGYLQQTELPNVAGVSQTEDVKRARATITGSHTQMFSDTLLLRANVGFVTDPNYFQQLSNSGTLRASPSNESNLLATQRLPYGNLYLLGRYLQPLQAGGRDTFQRLPEAGYNLPEVPLFNSPLLFGAEGNFVNFYREQGFTLNRVDVTPGIATDVIDFGHVVGVRPQAKFREVYYSRGARTAASQHRETFWIGVDAMSKLTRRYGLEGGGSLLHTIEPTVTYEYVPATDQSNLTLIDQVDDLPRKNLLTYAFRSRVLEQNNAWSFNWLDLTVAQSYHVGSVQTLARDFTPGVDPFLGSVSQPIQPRTVPIQGRKFSDIWVRAVIGNNMPHAVRSQLDAAGFDRAAGLLGAGERPPINRYLMLDAFIDPYEGTVSQVNTDIRLQEESNWYVEIGQRYSRSGTRVRRGDIWNPISFNEVYAPTGEILFLTASGAFRTPWGWTIGAKGYYDVKQRKSPEYDVVALYQNPCKCWSVGFYYVQFPDRHQFNFMLSLTGLGWTENTGTAVMRSILSPLLWGEKGLPWYVPWGQYGRTDRTSAAEGVSAGSR